MSIDTTITDSQDTGSSAWDMAIQDAEARLAAAKKEAIRLKRAIEVFRERKEAGAKWPVKT